MSSGLSPHLCQVLCTLAAFRTPVFDHHSPLPFRNFPVCFSLTSPGPDAILRGSFSLPTLNTHPWVQLSRHRRLPRACWVPCRVMGPGLSTPCEERRGKRKKEKKERRQQVVNRAHRLPCSDYVSM